MRAKFRLSDLIPAELNVDAVHDAADAIIVAAYGRSQDCRCPHCGTASRRVHSRYPDDCRSTVCGPKDRIAPDGPTLRL